MDEGKGSGMIVFRRFAVAAALLCGALVLNGCGPDAPPDPDRGPDRETRQDLSQRGALIEPRDPDAPRAGPETSDRFEYLRYAAEMAGDQPRLCLTFSGALDPEVDYSAYVSINEPVALGVDGQRLCLGGLTFGQTRAITLRQGLPAADGRTLAADQRETLTFADRPAFIRFAGSGVILPRIDADGVAIETVNVEAVRVTVSRVTDRALVFRTLTEGFGAGTGEWAWMGYDEQPREAGVEVFQGEMDTSGPVNAPVTTVFPIAEAIGEARPGAYYLRVENLEELESGRTGAIARAERWLIVTDLAFTAYRGETGLDVVLRSLQTARPAQGVAVRLIARSNEVLAEASSDSEGRVRFERALLDGREGDAPRMLMAYGPQGDFAVLDLGRAPVDLSGHPVSGRSRAGAADGYIWLDRGIYRPGETIHASALLRGPEGAALTGRAGTLSLYAPNGLEYAQRRFEDAPRGGAVIESFTLPEAAARGQWRLAVTVDGVGEVAGQSLSVEDFVPQRVALTLSGDAEAPLRANETRMIEAHARFLYGAPGAGLPVSGTVRIQPDPAPFGEHEGFRFGVHDEQFGEETFDLPIVAADGQGEAVLPISPETRGADSTLPLRARAIIRVQEPGGRAVADDVRIPYRPRDLYLGLADGFDGGAGAVDRPVRYRALAVDGEGAPVRAEIDWRLVRNDWSYDWYRSDNGAWRWRRSQRVVPIEEGRVVADGEAGAEIATRALDWGDYTLIAQVDGETLASAGFWVGYGAAPEAGMEAPDRVRLSGPASPPQTGDSVEISILAPYAGRAEIVLAADQVIETRSIDVPEGGTQISFDVDERWGAGVYAMVSVYTPRDAVDQPRPRRAVGVIHLPLDTGPRTFELELDTPERIEPDQTLDVTVTATSGPVAEEAWLTLAAVDEGILQLTGFVSPDPAGWFFGKTALGVDLLDDYGRLLDPNQGPAAAVRSGGDQIGAAGLSVVPTRTVALFEGPVAFDAQGRAVVPLEIPDFNGELRLMAVAWSETGVGAADQALTVRDDAPAELILPRFLSPGDTAEATVTVDNIDGAAGRYEVAVSAEGPLELVRPGFDLDLQPGQRADRSIVLIADEAGIGGLGLSVSGPEGFSVSRDYPIEVRSAFLPASDITRVVLAPGESWRAPSDALAGFVVGTESLQISVAASPIDAAAIYQALSEYPYGCTEQIVSRAMPLLYADQMASLAGSEAPSRARGEIAQTIQTVLARQSEDGAFGLWRIGDGRADPWLGAYITDFLARARAAGHPVPEAALERAYQALQPVARGDLWRAWGYLTDAPDPRWSTDTEQRLNHRSAAYAGYVLARAGRADRSRLRYMHDEMLRNIESPLARAQVGAALAAIGDRARAASAFEAATAALGFDNPGDVYQSRRRDLAGVLALAAEAGQTDRVEALAERVGEDLPEPDRLTTQEKAFLLLAARALAGPGDRLSLSHDGEPTDQTVFAHDAGSIELAGEIVNESDSPVWLTAFARGAPVSAPPPAAEGLTLEKTVFTRGGERVDLDEARQGEQFIIALTVTPRQTAHAQLIIEDLLPAGFEIEGVLRINEAAPDGAYRWLGELTEPSIAESRDDRFVAALDTRGRQPLRLAYMVRAVTPGRFTLPGAVAEDMYRPDVFARSEAGMVTIRP